MSRKKQSGPASIVLSFMLFTPCGATAPPAPANLASDYLRAALLAFDRKDLQEADRAVSAALDDPSFGSLDEATRHMAVALGAKVMLQNRKPESARQLALRASQMPQQDVDDWRTRLSADLRLEDARDETECVSEVYRQWGANSAILPDDTIFSVFRESLRTELSDVRLGMLEALYERRWRPADDRTASGLWRELTRLLLEANQTRRAAEVASLIDDPDDIIAIQVDDQFKPVRNSQFVQSNAERAARDRIKQRQDLMRQNPRSLRLVQRLLAAEVTYRMDSQALMQIDEVERRIQQAGSGSAEYDAFESNYNWILDIRARALRHLGRYEEAVEVLRRATQLTDRGDTVSQSINLAALLCELDRPQEALAVLPLPDQLSPYGRMQIHSIRLSAALERGSPEDAAQEVAYLKEHRADSPATFQHALLRVGETDEAEKWLLSRLSDPVQRASALLEMQRYFEQPRPPRAEQWHQLSVELANHPTVRAAAAKVGRIGSYTWRYDTYD